MPKKSKANGEGHIGRRANGKYYGQISYGRGSDGKLIRKTVYADSHEECRKLLNELIHERDKGYLPVKQGKITVGELALHYYLHIKAHKASAEDKKPGISNSTWNWYIDMTNWYIIPKLNTPIGKFNKGKAQAFFDDLAEMGLSVSTIKGIQRTLNPVMKYAIEQNYIRLNPLQSVLMGDSESEGEDKEMFIEKEDLRFIIEKLNEYSMQGKYNDLRDIILTCTYTGMRIGEVLGLRIRDIDLENNTVKICQQSKKFQDRNTDGKVKSYSNGAGTLKTKESKRELPISEVWRTVLEGRLQTLKGLGKPELLKPDAFIFCNQKGQMRTYSGTRSIYIRFMQRIGFGDKGYTLHSFRHSFISHARAAGMAKDAVTRYVGHSSSKVTDEIYRHLTLEEKKAITVGIDRAFGAML